MSKKTHSAPPKSSPLEDALNTGIRHEATTGLAGPRLTDDRQTEMRSRSENVRDADRPTSDTFRADAQMETAEAGDDSALHSSNNRPGEDDARAKEILATSAASVFSPTGDADKDGTIAKSDDGTPRDTALSRGGSDSPDWHREDVKRQDAVTAGPDAPGEQNTQAVSALSNAPPYLLSRAETLYVAHCHAMEGQTSVPFNNLRPVERASWLAVARETEKP